MREDAVVVPSIPFKLPAVSTATGGRMLGKTQRAEAVTNLIEGGLVHIPEGAPWLDAFIDEHCDFPQGTHDDQVDTTVMALMRLSAVRQEVWDAFMTPTTIKFGGFGLFGAA
jgi:phage terminase large subunit-like protein